MTMYTIQDAQTFSVSTCGANPCEVQPAVKPRLLPERFGSTSVPVPGGLVDFGPESSTPTDFPVSQDAERHEYIAELMHPKFGGSLDATGLSRLRDHPILARNATTLSSARNASK